MQNGFMASRLSFCHEEPMASSLDAPIVASLDELMVSFKRRTDGFFVESVDSFFVGRDDGFFVGRSDGFFVQRHRWTMDSLLVVSSLWRLRELCYVCFIKYWCM